MLAKEEGGECLFVESGSTNRIDRVSQRFSNYSEDWKRDCSTGKQCFLFACHFFSRASTFSAHSRTIPFHHSKTLSFSFSCFNINAYLLCFSHKLQSLLPSHFIESNLLSQVHASFFLFSFVVSISINK